MATCDCVGSIVGIDCVLFSIQQWKSDESMLCAHCDLIKPIHTRYAATLQNAESLGRAAVNVLLDPSVYKEIYEKFTITHIDCQYIFYEFLRTYKKILNNEEYWPKLLYHVWPKDAIHAYFILLNCSNAIQNGSLIN